MSIRLRDWEFRGHAATFRLARSLLLLVWFTSCSHQRATVSAPGRLVAIDLVLPQGYQGPAFIWFDRAGGVPSIRRGEREVFHLPSDGLLQVRDTEPSTARPLDVRIRYEGAEQPIPLVLNDCDGARQQAARSARTVVACMLPYEALILPGRESPYYYGFVVADSSSFREALGRAKTILAQRILSDRAP